MPNKTIYVSDADMALYRKAQELAGGNLSAAISTALRHYIEIEQGRQEGFDDIVVRVGPGKGRKQRFAGVLLGEWGHASSGRAELFRVYRSRQGKFVLHIDRTEGWEEVGPGAERWNTGWRGWIGNWSADSTWLATPAEGSLHVADTLAELRDLLPPELYDAVVDAAEQPVIEDLDI
jgi:EXLDI family protein